MVDVEAAADDATADGVSAQLVLDEDAAKFAVAGIDVVGPLDSDERMRCGEGMKDGVTNAEGDELGEREEMGGWQESRVEEKAEQKVLTALGLP